MTEIKINHHRGYFTMSIDSKPGKLVSIVGKGKLWSAWMSDTSGEYSTTRRIVNFIDRDEAIKVGRKFLSE